MTDEPDEAPPKPKLIDGSVDAVAGAAQVAINDAPEPVRFCVREIVHHRYACHPESGKELERHTLIEYEVLFGDPPPKWSRFQGLGLLTASTPPPPLGMGNQRREYRFNIYAEDVDEAWSKFEEFNKLGAAQADAAFRREFAAWSAQQQQRLAVVGPGAAAGILDAHGQPHRGG